MGCYAAFNALKLAHHITKADPESCVLMLCLELCTIHFQKGVHRDTLVSNALFADGAAAAIVRSEAPAHPSVKLKSFHCDLALDGKKDMAWHIANHGFEMTLSSYVPKAIGGGIKSLTDNLLKKINLKREDVQHYAIHPGGRRILEVIEEALGLSKEDNCHAYEVLRDYGNMSSATVLFVINSILQTLTSAHNGNNMLSFAFGPGLTMESLLMEVKA
jgi:predicted naringenin-chalcone synthase